MFLLGAPGGCSDDPVNLDIPDMKSQSELLIGSWEFLETSVDGEVTPLPEDELFWYFLANNSICTLEKYPDGTYGPDFSGGYTATDSIVKIFFSLGDQMSFGYSFSDNLDTLKIKLLDSDPPDMRGLMLRVSDAPANEWCP